MSPECDCYPIFSPSCHLSGTVILSSCYPTILLSFRLVIRSSCCTFVLLFDHLVVLSSCYPIVLLPYRLSIRLSCCAHGSVSHLLRLYRTVSHPEGCPWRSVAHLPQSCFGASCSNSVCSYELRRSQVQENERFCSGQPVCETLFGREKI